jgi:DNA-binding SARP family transcriptional activator/WD40 repeat protein
LAILRWLRSLSALYSRPLERLWSVEDHRRLVTTHAETTPIYAEYSGDVDIRVLGPMEVLVNGVSVSLGGPRQRALLAIMISRVPAPVLPDVLINELWGEAASHGSRSTLQTLVSNLRQVLGNSIPLERGGYRLDVPIEAIDSWRFANLVDEVRPKITTSPREASEELRRGLEWWRARPYSDLVDVASIDAEVRRLEELRLEAVELRVDAELAAGLHGNLISELQALAEEYPLREHFRAQHMVALYRSGRQGEALRAFRETESFLAEELGVDPSPELQELELAILNQEESLLAGLAGATTQRLAVMVSSLDAPPRRWDQDPSGTADALATHDRALRQASESEGGRIVKRTGQGVVAVFSDTISAVRAAERALRDLHDSSSAGSVVYSRIGIDVGEAEVKGDNFTGPPITRAGSLCAVAHGGQALLSSAAQRDLAASAPAGLQVRQLGDHSLAEIASRERVAQLVFDGLPSQFPQLKDPRGTDLDERLHAMSIPGYEVRNLIREDSTGILWRAYQPSIGREVAIKALRNDIASITWFIRGFEVESRRVSRLTHPHIAPLIDFWRDADRAFHVFGITPIKSLDERIASGDVDHTEARRIVSQLGSALDHAHSIGVVHGALKPEHVVFDVAQNAYLYGFGITTDTPPPNSPEYEPARQRDLAALATLAIGLLPGLRPLEDDLTGHDEFATSVDLLAAIDAATGIEQPSASVSPDLRNPYKGMRPFDEADQTDFHGREDLIDSLLETLTGRRLVAVVGPSGSGKSSAVRAGLIPSLVAGAISESPTWSVVTIQPGSDPMASMAEGLSNVFQQPVSPDVLAANGLVGDSGQQIVVVIDQFEEIYTLVDDDEQRQDLTDLIVDAVEDTSRAVRIVICLRADFYDRPLAHTRLGPHVRDGTVSVAPPTRDELVEMIELPARSVGLWFEPGLVARIAEDVFHEPGGLPLLQYAMTELVERRSGNLLTSGDYERIGTVSGAIAQRAEGVFASLNPSDQAVARAILLRLTTVDEETGGAVRRRVRRSELEAVGLPSRVVGEVLDRFVAERLLLVDRDPVTRGPTVEVAHEALLIEWPRFARWIAVQQEALILARRLRASVDDWQNHDRGEGYLLSGPRLSTYAEWDAATALVVDEVAAFETPALTADERAFLRESRFREQTMVTKRRRRRHLVVGGFAIAAAVTSIMAVVASLNRAEADRAAQLAVSRELAASAINLLDENSELSLLLALEAIEAAPQGQAQPLEAVSALHDAVRRSRLLLARPPDSGESGGRTLGTLSPNGLLVAQSDLGESLEVWDPATGDTAWRADERFSGGWWSKPHFSSDSTTLAVAFNHYSGASSSEASPGLYVFDSQSGEEVGHHPTNSKCGWAATPDNEGFDDSGTQLMAIVPIDSNCDPGALEVQLVDLQTSRVTASTPATGRLEEGQPLGVTVTGGQASGILAVSDSTGEHGSARTIDLESGDVIWERAAAIAVLSPDGAHTAIYPGQDQRGVDVVGATTGELIRQVQVQGADAAHAVFSADGSRLYTAGFDGTVRVWDVATGDQLLALTGSGVGLAAPNLDREDRRLGAAGTDGKFYLWDLSVAPLGETMAHDLAPAQVTNWGVTAESGLVASIGFSGRCPEQYSLAVLLDAATGEELLPAFYDATGQSLAVSDDGKHLVHQTADPAGPAVSCDERSDGPLVVRTIGTGHHVTLDGLCSYNQVNSLLTVNPDPSAVEGECPFPPAIPYAEFVNDIDVADDLLVLAGGASGVASLWDGSTGDLLTTFGPHESRGMVQGVALDRTSGLVVVFTGGPQQRLDVYTRDGEPVHNIEFPDAAPASGRVAFHPEGGTLAAAVDRLALYDTETWDTVWDPVEAHDGGVGEIDFSPDGTKLMTIGRDGFVKVWSTSSGELLHTIPLGDDFAKGAAFVDDEHIAIGTQNGLLAVLTVDIEELVEIARSRLTRQLTDQECVTYLHRPCDKQ